MRGRETELQRERGRIKGAFVDNLNQADKNAYNRGNVENVSHVNSHVDKGLKTDEMLVMLIMLVQGEVFWEEVLHGMGSQSASNKGNVDNLVRIHSMFIKSA